MIGMPTPTVSPGAMSTDAVKLRAGAGVLNVV
jgi:hypothetical protein